MDVAEEKEEMRRKKGRRSGERSNRRERERVEEALLSLQRKFSIGREWHDSPQDGKFPSRERREREIPEGERRREGIFSR